MASITRDDEVYWIPSVSILMTRFTAKDYLVAFTKVIEKVQAVSDEMFDPSTRYLRIDFEKSVMATARLLGFNLELCLFHKNAFLWKKIQSLGLASRYREDVEFSEACVMTFVVNLVPALWIVDFWEAVRQSFAPLVHDANVKAYYYFAKRCFVGGSRNGEEIKPLYNAIEVSVYEQLVNGRGATTNPVEAWHAGVKLNNLPSKPRMDMWLDFFKSESRRCDSLMAQIAAGNVPRLSSKQRAQRARDQQLIKILDDLNDHDRADPLAKMKELCRIWVAYSGVWN